MNIAPGLNSNNPKISELNLQSIKKQKEGLKNSLNEPFKKNEINE
jgi:hypothetical protein